MNSDKKPRIGRPPTGGPQPLRNFRASPEAWQAVQDAAETEDMSASAWIRKTLLAAAKRLAKRRER